MFVCSLRSLVENFFPRLALKEILFTMAIRSIFLVLLHGFAMSRWKGENTLIERTENSQLSIYGDAFAPLFREDRKVFRSLLKKENIKASSFNEIEAKLLLLLWTQRNRNLVTFWKFLYLEFWKILCSNGVHSQATSASQKRGGRGEGEGEDSSNEQLKREMMVWMDGWEEVRGRRK